ncbi:MAG: DUF4340 domain-containing protein [Eubacteriales bacterium]|nr:DUF4340 domain-containing protein [Eubacteriales bacterium]
MKMKKNLLILLGVVALLAVAVIVILSVDGINKGEAEATPAPTSKPLVKLIQKSLEEVKSVAVDYDGDHYTLTKDASGVYSSPEYPGIEIKSSYGDVMFSSAADFYALDVISQEQTDLANYGLAKPQCTLVFTYTDGTSQKVLVGDKTPSGTAYYMVLDGDPRVLTMSYSMSLNYFYRFNQIRPVVDITTSTDDFQYMKLEVEGKVAMEADIIQGDDKVGITTIEIVNPWRSGVNSEKFVEYLDAIAKFGFSGVAEGGKDDLAAFGLDAPYMTMNLKTGAKEYTLLVGSISNVEGYRYAKLSDSDLIYYFDNAQVTTLETKPYDLMDRLVLLVGIGTIQSFRFDGLGQDLQINVEQTYQVDENGEQVLDSEGQPKATQNFTCDGKPSDGDQSRYFFQYCSSITADTVLKEDFAPQGDALASIAYTKLSGAETRIDFYEYDTDFYAVSVNGASHFGVRKEKVKDIADAVTLFREGTLRRYATSITPTPAPETTPSAE